MFSFNSFDYLPNDINVEEATYEMHGWIIHNMTRILEKLFVLENDFFIFNEKWSEPYSIINKNRYLEIKKDFFNMDKIKVSDLFLVEFDSEKSIYKDILSDYAYEYKGLRNISRSMS